MTRKEIAAMFNAVDLDFSKVLADVRAGHYDRAADTFDHAIQTITGFLDSVDPDAFWDEKRDAFFLLADAIQDNLSRPSQTRQKYDALYHDLLQWLSSITVLNADMSAYALGYTDGNSYSAEYQPDVDALKLGAGSDRSVQSRLRSAPASPFQGVSSRFIHSNDDFADVFYDLSNLTDDVFSGLYDRALDTFGRVVRILTPYLDVNVADDPAYFRDKRHDFNLLAEAVEDSLSSLDRLGYDKVIYQSLLDWLRSLNYLLTDIFNYESGMSDGREYESRYRGEVDALSVASTL